MKKISWRRIWRALASVTLVALALTAVSMYSGGGMVDAYTGPEKIAGLYWLEGKWRGMIGDNVFEAIYTSPEGGQVLSVSKEFATDRPAFIEFERFHMVDTFVVLTPYPGGDQSVPFTMTVLDEEEQFAKFSNPEHDFPNDISYHAIGKDSLVIEVSGIDDNNQRTGFTVNLKRMR